MGRAKLNMELIKKEKDRRITFHTRMKNLMKKAYELTTLCDIKIMVIVYGPKLVTQEARSFKLQTFPENRDKVLELINKYKGLSSEDRKKRTFGLLSFFEERNRKAKQALDKLRDTNVQSKYPIWDSRYNNFNESDLRRAAAVLENNIENAKAKLGQMRADNNRSNNIYHAYLQRQQMMLTNERSMDLEVGNQNGRYLFTIDPHQAGFMQVPVPMPMPIQQQNFTFMDHHQDQRMVRFGHDYIGGPSNTVYNAHPSTALYNYPTMAEMDSITYANNLSREPPINYNRGTQPIAQHHMEHHYMRPGSAPHQTVATFHQVGAHDQFNENQKE